MWTEISVVPEVVCDDNGRELDVQRPLLLERGDIMHGTIIAHVDT